MELISCTLPTRGRQEWAAQAVACFLSQTYENKELVILDDAEEPSFPKGPESGFPRSVIYIRHQQSLTIPEKRNRIVNYCRGRIICHFDSDDWSAPERLSTVMQLMQSSEKQVCGFFSMLFVIEPEGRAYRYSMLQNYALGTSLFYTKASWQAHPFEEKKALGSDNQFVYAARSENDLACVDAGQLMVARIHSGNTNAKRVDNTRAFQLVDWDVVPKGFRDARGQ